MPDLLVASTGGESSELYAEAAATLDIGPVPNPGAGGRFEAIDDEISMHLGLEDIAFIGTTPLTLHGGVYTDPDGIKSIDSRETIYTFGIGSSSANACR